MTKPWQLVWLVVTAALAQLAVSGCSSGEGRRIAGHACQTALDCDATGVDGGAAAACTVATCTDNECGTAPATDGTLCDDGDPGTLEDACASGRCKGTSSSCPAATDPCKLAVVDPATGACAARPKPDGTACEDGDLCTQADTCASGACVGGAARDCSATEPCHLPGTCDPATGDCGNPAAPDGTACDDALACTEKDVCTAGACRGAAVACDDGRSCSTDSCDEALGGCHSDVTTCKCAANADCDDGNACNGAETCNTSTSACESGAPLDCSSLTDACHTGSCDAKTGACVAGPVADGTACNDGDQCTRSDTCQSGACTGADPIACGAPGQCSGGSTCDPATGICVAGDKPDGTACDDADPCTSADVCRGGTCTGDAVICTAADACHAAGTCNPVTGACSSAAQADGTTCDDRNLCTPSDVCVSGVCTGGSEVPCAASDPCHLAGSCDPTTGTCSNPPAPDGAACDDGLLCTQADVCSGGACRGAAIQCSDARACTVDTCSEALGGCTFDGSACSCSTDTDCDDGNACNGAETCDVAAGTCTKGTPKSCTALNDACNVGSCSPATGACVKVPKANGTTCTDGNACTQTDSCQAGKCVGQSPVVCTAADACHNPGTCNPGTGACTSPAKPDGSTCNDGNLCTQTDTCQSGTCLGQTPVACAAQDQCHAAGACNPATGVCSNPAKPNGAACSDGNACTQADSCQAGTCTGASPVTCTAQDQCHAAGTCAPATGLCSNPQKANNAACDDGDACTQSDTCQAGSCTGASPVTCTAQDRCHAAGACDTATGLCSNPAKPNGSTCSDGNACTKSDVCQAGVCAGGSAVVCVAQDQCHAAGTCNTGTGLCSNPALPNGTTCNDGLVCTTTDTCTAGTCSGPAMTCNDGIACTVDSCTEAAGGCTTDKSACGCTKNADCNDGNACNGVETCNLATLTCKSGTPIDCSTLGNACNTGTCNPASGACSAVPKANGTGCNDGNACTQSDSCQSGTCTGANPVVCAAQDQCHAAGACAPATGVCSNPAKTNGAACNDGNACTQTDTCQAGACTGASPVTCTALDQCHAVGTCSTVSGACSNPAKANGAACNDGNACTQTDTCQAGACTGASPVTCAPVDQCHTGGTCNAATGACSSPNQPTGTPCDDGNACTQTDTCQAGTCTGTTPVVCTALDQCHSAGVCAPATGTCSNPQKANSTACNDNDACTRTDSCQAGTCTGTTPVVCAALDQCHAAGVCAPASGVCSNPPKADGAACSDGSSCTQADSCQAGVCTGASPVVCAAQDQCHAVGTCSPASGTCSNPLKADGMTCSDGNQCTQVDTCKTGVCTGSNPVVCTALSQCHNVGVCAPSSGVCSNPPKASGSACNDANFCTQSDACNGSGSCSLGTAVTCLSSLNPCKTTSCVSTVGCVTSDKPDGTACNDGTSCTQTDSCLTGTCTGTNTRDDKIGDWADAPGGQGAGPTSIDLMTFSGGRLAAVGVYSGPVTFAGKALGLNATFTSGLYLAVYAEAGVGGNGSSLSRVTLAGVGLDVQGAPGAITVGGAAMHPDDTFTVVGTFTGPATFGSFTFTTSVQTLYVAHFAKDGTALWVATGDSGGAVTGEAVAAFADGSVVVSGVNGATQALTITDVFGSTASIPVTSIYAARFLTDGTLVFGRRVATRGAGRGIGVKAVTTHSDGSFTLLGAFAIGALVGPQGEATLTSLGGSDAWLLRCESDGKYRWSGRMGGGGADRPGDVQGVDSDDVVVAVDVLGAAPTLAAAGTVSLHTVSGGTSETNVVRLDKSGVPLFASVAENAKGASQGWDLGYDSDKSVTLAGVFTTVMSYYDSVGFGTGAPAGTPLTLTDGTATKVLAVTRYEPNLKRRWTIAAGGAGSSMTTQTGWDIVLAVHPSLSVSVGGMFQGQSVFGEALPKTLLSADKAGSPFVVHLDSQEALDYCP